MPTKKERIWEIDAVRGLCMLGVIISHLVFDISEFTEMTVSVGPVFDFVFTYGGALFIIISGVSATLGSKSFKRGVLVFACGAGVTAVTFALFKLGYIYEDDIVNFGILSLLGTCMMLYPVLKKLGNKFLLALAVAAFAAGLVFKGITLPYTEGFALTDLLFVLGIKTVGFTSGDYFPIFPNAAFFMLGIVLGRKLYKDKKTRLPDFRKDFFPMNFLCFLGRHSLVFYLAHQPVLFLFFMLITG